MVKKTERSEAEAQQMSGVIVSNNGGWPGQENGGAVSRSAYHGAGITPIGSVLLCLLEDLSHQCIYFFYALK